MFPSAPKPAMTFSRQCAIERGLGWRADEATGLVACPECNKDNRPDASYCIGCGNALQPLERYQGVQAGETEKCAHCGRMTTPEARWCPGCGKPMSGQSVVTTPANSRPMSGSTRAAVRGSSEFGHGRQDRFMATRSFTYVDSTGQTQHIKAGITFVNKQCEAFKLHPSADYWAA
jgi:RNA polymerase subunit RPABC4/transcription elongation factor Spt4